MVCDTDGFAIYWVLDDEAIECTACDPDPGEPEDWPAWTDADWDDMAQYSGHFTDEDLAAAGLPVG
jgi:hypothetical protein